MQTGFGIAPVNKLVSLTWLLWALRSFRSFTLHLHYINQLFTIQPPRSTRSSSAVTLLRPSVTSSLKFADRSIAIAHQSLASCYLSTALSLQTENTALQQILS